jgi:predicted PurR-regulated permease PerM
MRKVHQTAITGAFAFRYWGVVGFVLATPLLVIALSAAGQGQSPERYRGKVIRRGVPTTG